ncbi:hypothetical protein CO667_30995 [Rhizobium sp. L43]|nr:hypothetical protein CO667_30995 [Rhizobium sp. L43]
MVDRSAHEIAAYGRENSAVCNSRGRNIFYKSVERNDLSHDGLPWSCPSEIGVRAIDCFFLSVT